MTTIPWTGLLVGALIAAPAAAQDRSAGSDLKDFGRDAWFIVSSPARAGTSDLQTAGIAIAGVGAALLLDETVHEWVQSEPAALGLLAPFRISSPGSLMGRTWFFLLPLSIALYGAGHAFDSEDLRDAGLGCATSNLTTTFTRSATALLIGRARPSVERGPFQFELLAFGDWDRRSFPGGHASNIMSCASYFNHRFDLGVAEPAIWAVAAANGAARIVDEAHWLSDTVYGMAYGYAIGRNVALRHLDRAARREAERSLRPLIRLRWKITF
ncbi:MAG TPA: phosphatase PAP2 family protein [Longimicrobiales bacterium]